MFGIPFPILSHTIIPTFMLTPRFVNLYGYVFLGIVVAMLALVWFRLVPQSVYVPLFLVALVLYGIRIAMRLLLERQRRLQERDKKQGVDPTDGKREE
jgi:hypothetical protein